VFDIKEKSQDDRIRERLTVLFRLTEKIHKDGFTTLDEGRELLGPILEPLIETDYFKIDGTHLVIGKSAPSAENARKLKNMMNHFLIMRPIWDTWKIEQKGAKASRRRKKKTEDFLVDLPGLGAIPIPIRSDRITSLSNNLAERGLLMKSKDGKRNIYRFSDWFRACFQALREAP